MKCPKCKTVLLLGSTKCYEKDCGWKAETQMTQTKADNFPKPNTICHWELPGKRCPMPSAGRNGNEGAELCWFHARYSGKKWTDEDIFNWVDSKLGGHATEIHDFYVDTIHNAATRAERGNWRVKWDEVHRARSAAEGWYLDGVKTIMRILEAADNKYYGGPLYVFESDFQDMPEIESYELPSDEVTA